MTIAKWLKDAENTLRKTSSTPHLDAVVIAEHVLKCSREYLLAHDDLDVEPHVKRLNSLLMRRMAGVPVAYLRGYAEFYGRKFRVNKRVLVPRPETEDMVDLLKELRLDARTRVADVGTGSGCIGVTAALELPEASVHFYDIDPDALAIANANARKHKVTGQYYQSDLLDPNWGPYSVVLANLPYVPDKMPVNSGDYEPHIALFGGEDGLDLYRQLFEQLGRFGWKPKFVLTESLTEQFSMLDKIAGESDYTLASSRGLIRVYCPKAV